MTRSRKEVISMKRFQRTLALMLAIMTIMAAMSVPALAESYKVATLKTGTWYKVPYYSDMKTIYKLKLTADSIVTISWKGNKAEYLRLYFYDNKACEYDFYDPDFYEARASQKAAFAKGTYYLMMYDLQERPTSQIKITVKKAINKANYCRAKAIALKSGETVTIAQTADHCYDRWYKITVPKKKIVTITTSEYDAEDITLYDAKMQTIECTSGSKKVITEDKIAKGTYFIRVSGGYSNAYLGNCITLKWN